MRLPTHKAAMIAGVLVALLYALLAGWSVPTQRTIFMLMTFAAALLLARNLAISRVLAIALIVIVLCDPWAVIAPGIWLSFGAVALISYVTVNRLKAAHWLKVAITTQWAITLGLLPLLILMFGQTSIISPLANAFAIPVISLLVVPLAIFGSLLSLDFVLQSSHFILQICMHGLNYLANLPTWQQAAPPIWTVLVAMFGVLWLLLPRGIPLRWLGLIFLLPLFVVEVPKPNVGEMRVAVLDVGQGLAVVIQTKNHTLLYDAGSRYSAQSDAGSKIIVPYLRGEGIAKLDGFVVSHNDVDHSGGAASVLAQVPVTWLASSFDLVSDKLPKKAIKCFAGQHWRWDKVDFEVLHPSLESYEDENISDNNRSCVVKVTSQFGSILLTGDIEKEAEKAILDNSLQPNIHKPSSHAALKENELKSDILTAPHHGSKTSSTPEFIAAVGAKQIIFTVGYLNRFKHPKPLIEKRFEESGAISYRSDYHGALLFDFTYKNPVKIEAWRQSQPRYWQEKYAS
jgi:competence protein ComEC